MYNDNSGDNIISLGRLIHDYGVSLVWSKASCHLKMRDGELKRLPVTNFCPYLEQGLLDRLSRQNPNAESMLPPAEESFVCQEGSNEQV